MTNIRLCAMTKDLCRAYHQRFAFDPAMFSDMDQFRTYTYSQAHADAHWQRQQDLGRVHLAILLDESVIGEVVLKSIDHHKKCCTMGIHLTDDSVKNKGYGTKAETLTLQYAFDEMGMDTVYADALLKNTRSQHVLQKVRFREIKRDDEFVYYRCDKTAWIKPAADVNHL